MGFFTDKAVIVTGGASGIGRAVSEELARRGACLTLADVNAGLLEETALSITKAGGRAKPVTLDVTDPEAVKKLVDDTVSDMLGTDLEDVGGAVHEGGEKLKGLFKK